MPYAYFWTGQIIYDVTYLLLLIGLLFLGFASYRIPRLYPRLFEAVVFYKEDIFFEEVKRYIAPILFLQLGRLQSALVLALTLYLYIDAEGFLAGIALEEMILLLSALFVGMYLFFSLHRSLYRALGYVYLSTPRYRSWKNGYNLLEWLWSLPLYPALLMMTSTQSLDVGIWIAVTTFFIWRIFVIRRTISVLKETHITHLQLSLYLCTHEVAPFALLAWVAIRGYV